MPAKGGGNRLNIRSTKKQIIDNKKMNKGTIVGQGKYKVATKLACNAFNILAMVTSQKFLADINANLEKISEDLNYIKKYLNNERTGKIIGNIAYLEEIFSKISNNKLTNNEISAYINSIEQIDRECYQIIFAIERDMIDRINCFKRIPLPKYFIIGSNSDVVLNNITEFKEASEQLLFCMQLKILVNKVRILLQVDQQQSLSSISKVKYIINNFIIKKEHYCSIVHKWADKLHHQYLIFETRESFKNTYYGIKNIISTVSKTLNETEEFLNKDLLSIEKYLNDLENDLKIEVSLNKKKEINSIKLLKGETT
jgi:hypothetical protein